MEITESSEIYQYDSNTYSEYIDGTEKVETPWNFIKNGDLDILKVTVSKEKGYYAINTIESNNALLAINPTSLSAVEENLTFPFSGSGRNIIEVRACHDSEPELMLFTEDPKSFVLELYRVCESDDDFQVLPVGTVVESPTEVCIDGGEDGTIDLMFNDEFIPKNPVTNKRLDIISYNAALKRYQVYAGENLKCDAKAHPNSEPLCPGVFDENDFIAAMNDLYKRIGVVGMHVSLETININYDVVKDDGKLDNELEQQALYANRSSIDQALIDNVLEVHFVEDLGFESSGNKLLGKAIPYLGSNFLVIDRKDANGLILAHEVGHARYSLEHPGCPCTTTYFGEFPGVVDKKNFMHGSQKEEHNIRRYQFNKIHDK